MKRLFKYLYNTPEDVICIGAFLASFFGSFTAGWHVLGIGIAICGIIKVFAKAMKDEN